ncbi:MAG: Sua5/YciO/YrdC/YwlC family protein [Saprospiraceae bacterium]|nr:Sua5/YciO/YrdC/YwlC family protein [Saprospiraceae bacterium]MCB9326019.1 Sua5/YciO/YrdC/YwlC family protein [Lewinellaceae bacterium]
MTTFTKRTTLMFPNYELNDALNTLRRGGLILYPTDTLWSIGCDATHEEAVEKVLSLIDSKATVEIIVDSIPMLKQYIKHLHPRIETLLLYHTRPLSIKFGEPVGMASHILSSDTDIAFRICQDDYCRELIAAFGGPLATCFASFDEKYLPTTFGAISSEVIQAVDYVSRYRQDDKTPGEPSVVITLSEEDELVFLRE